MQVKEILLADIIDRPIFLTVKNDNNFKYTIKGDTRNLKFQKTNKTLIFFIQILEIQNQIICIIKFTQKIPISPSVKS